MKKGYVLLLVLVVGALLAAGCTAFEGSQSVAPGDNFMEREVPSATPAAYADEEMAAYAPAPIGMKTGAASSFSISEQDQKIIRTASIKLEVLNVTVSADEVQEIAKRYDGIIQSSSVYAGSKNRYSGTVTIRIPALHFDAALTDIQAIGKVLSSSVNAQDVTEEYVDLEAQKNALTHQLTQYNRLLEKGQNVSEVLEVQKEIERVQVELDRIVGRLRYLDSRVSYSTITVSLSEPAQVETPGGYSFASVISEGIAGFVNTIVWLFVFILTLLPLILVGGAGYWVYRRWKKNKAE